MERASALDQLQLGLGLAPALKLKPKLKLTPALGLELELELVPMAPPLQGQGRRRATPPGHASNGA